jgi:uncharacterized membrane protein
MRRELILFERMEIMRRLACACFISHQFFSFGKITLLAGVIAGVAFN